MPLNKETKPNLNLIIGVRYQYLKLSNRNIRIRVEYFKLFNCVQTND